MVYLVLFQNISEVEGRDHANNTYNCHFLFGSNDLDDSSLKREYMLSVRAISACTFVRSEQFGDIAQH